MKVNVELILSESTYIYCPLLRYSPNECNLNIYSDNGNYVIATEFNSKLWENLSRKSLTLVGKVNKSLEELEQDGINVKTLLGIICDSGSDKIKGNKDLLINEELEEEADTSTFGKRMEPGSSFE